MCECSLRCSKLIIKLIGRYLETPVELQHIVRRPKIKWKFNTQFHIERMLYDQPAVVLMVVAVAVAAPLWVVLQKFFGTVDDVCLCAPIQ